MSGSPKYCHAALEAERRRRAELEREARAREEAERRAAMERRLAKERRDRLRDQATTQATLVTQALDALLEEPAARFVSPDASSDLRNQIEQAIVEANRAP